MVGVLSVLVFLVVCVLLYRQTTAEEQEDNLDNDTGDSFDIMFEGENKK